MPGNNGLALSRNVHIFQARNKYTACFSYGHYSILENVERSFLVLFFRFKTYIHNLWCY